MDAALAVTNPSEEILRYGPKIMLLGGGGSGKSHSLRTMLEVPGIEVMSIMTEPSGMETLEDTPKDRFHWQYIKPASTDWDTLVSAARTINTNTNDVLQKMGGIEKFKYGQWMDFVTACKDYKCDRCGKAFGDISYFKPNQIVAIDSLSGLNEMAMNLVVGLKPIRTQPDWGVAMNNLERFVVALTTGVPTMCVITAHIEKETDEMTGGLLTYAATLGRKLGPRIGRFFSDIILARRMEGQKFEWSTGAFGVDLKSRSIPMGQDHLTPSFKPIIERWHARIGFKP